VRDRPIDGLYDGPHLSSSGSMVRFLRGGRDDFTM